MKELLMKLASVSGPSGSEKHIREILSELIQPLVDEQSVDTLGNLVAIKKGSAADRTTILLEANMDETGVMAIHIEEQGFVRIVPVGQINPVHLIGERIRFTNRTWGVIGAESGKSPKDLTFADLYVDIGAETREEAEKRLPIGTSGVIDKGAFEIGEFRIAGKALDNRAGCAVLVDVLAKLGDLRHDLIVVFAAQKQVGSRGIKTAAFRTDADFALVLGAARAGDMPKAERSSLSLGKGPAVKVMDRGIIVPPTIKKQLVETAERLQISYQLEVSPEGTSDAGQILLSRDGIPTGAVSVPVRYVETSSQVVDMRDLEQASKLVLETIRNW
jgi:endoglucanase